MSQTNGPIRTLHSRLNCVAERTLRNLKVDLLFKNKMLETSDYGSGSSIDSSTSMGIHDIESWNLFQSRLRTTVERPRKSSSFADLMTGRCTLGDVMQEFRMNGSDSPYQPEDDQLWSNKKRDNLAGMGPSNVYLRQKSWPAPECTPVTRLQRPTSWVPTTDSQVTPMHVDEVPPTLPQQLILTQPEILTEEQRRVLNSLPDATVYSLLRHMELARDQEHRVKKRLPEECRFCKNNGERESYYRSHTLKDSRGRVECPVLRAFTCSRCGARGDTAHTLKYCPLTSREERHKSTAMMRSLRMASGRRRVVPSSEHYVMFGETSPSLTQDLFVDSVPLDPIWAELEKKLML